METVEACLSTLVDNCEQTRAVSCEQCSRTFKKPSKLQRHIDETHNQVRKFGCEVCQQSFKRKEQLKRHQLSHTHEKNFPCPQCVMRFGYKHHVDRHVKLVHRNELYRCEECRLEFPKKRSLAKHIKSHLKEDVDGQAQTKLIPKTKRIRKRSGDRKMWSCQQCSEAFYKLVSLRRHTERQHGRDQSTKGQIFLEDEPCEKVVDQPLEPQAHTASGPQTTN